MGRIFGSIAHCWNTRLRPPHLRSLMEVLAVFTPKGQIASLVPRSGKDTTFRCPKDKLAGPVHLSIQNTESPLGKHVLPFREETS